MIKPTKKCIAKEETSMNTSSILSIGYGNREIDDFIAILKEYAIEFLLDLRSKPYSKYKIDFSGKLFETNLQKNGIKYVFMGDSLGGLPSDTSCYTEEGYVDYSQMESKKFYQDGVKRLITAHEKKIPLVIMCSESKPHECHRSKLIGETLQKNGIELRHIDETGNILLQQDVIAKLKNNQPSLFGEKKQVFTSRKKSSFIPSRHRFPTRNHHPQ